MHRRHGGEGRGEEGGMPSSPLTVETVKQGEEKHGL